MPAASASSPRSTASSRREVVEAGIAALKAVWHRGAVDADGKTGDGAGIHVEIPQDFFAARRRTRRRRRQARPDRRRHGLPAEDRSRRAGTLPPDRRDRNPQLRLHDLRLAPGADQRRLHRREGQRHAPRDRADHDLERQGRRRGASSSATSTSSAAGSKSRRSPRRSRTATSARCRAARSSTRACSWPSSLTDFYPDLLRPALHLPLRDLPPALFDQHLPDLAAGPAVPHARAQRRDQHRLPATSTG